MARKLSISSSSSNNRWRYIHPSYYLQRPKRLAFLFISFVFLTFFVWDRQSLIREHEAKMTKLSQDLLRLQNQLQEFKSGSAETMITTNALAGRFALNKSSGDYVIRPSSSGLSKATIECLRLFFSDLEGDHISTKSGDFLNSRYQVLGEVNIGQLFMHFFLYLCTIQVLKCVDALGPNLVAIKVFHGNKGSHAMGVVDMLTPLKLSMHDKGGVNFVQIQTSFMHSKHFCIVYECLGPSLYKFQCQNKNEQLPIEFIHKLGRELLQSIALMHDLHFVHASLSPAHVLFASYYKEDTFAFKFPCQRLSSGLFTRYKSPAAVKLINFASSFFEYDDIPCIKSRRPYRAPEVILGLRLSCACDVWSVSCILVELCLGKQLFRTAEDLDHLAMMECVFGKLPQYMLQKAAYILFC